MIKKKKNKSCNLWLAIKSRSVISTHTFPAFDLQSCKSRFSKQRRWSQWLPFSRKQKICVSSFFQSVSFTMILISSEDDCLLPLPALPPPFRSHLHGQKRGFARNTFWSLVPLIKSPVTSGPLYQPSISITSPPQWSTWGWSRGGGGGWASGWISSHVSHLCFTPQHRITQNFFTMV